MKNFDLHKNKVNSGFKTPPNYFDNLEDTIVQKIKSNIHKPTPKIWHNKQFWFTSVAASFILFFSYILYTNQNSKLDNVLIENYIISNATTDEITNQLTEKDIEELSKKILKKEDLQEYVNIDLNYYSNWED